VQALPAEESNILTSFTVPAPLREACCCGCDVAAGGACPSSYWYMLLIPINDAATKSTITDTEVFPNMVLRLVM
jgi:hypothetical protein